MIASLIIIVHISACATSASKNNNQNITDEFEKTLTDEENMCVANTIEQFFSDNTHWLESIEHSCSDQSIEDIQSSCGTVTATKHRNRCDSFPLEKFKSAKNINDERKIIDKKVDKWYRKYVIPLVIAISVAGALIRGN